MEIDYMREDDLEQVCTIEDEIFSSPWDEKSFLDSIKHNDRIYLVAKEDKEVLGYCGMWNAIDEGQITNVAVKEEKRNKKIGYNMLKALINEGKNNNLKSVTLEVRVSNEEAIHLYHKFGFKDCGIRKGYYSKPKEDAIIMWLK